MNCEDESNLNHNSVAARILENASRFAESASINHRGHQVRRGPGHNTMNAGLGKAQRMRVLRQSHLDLNNPGAGIVTVSAGDSSTSTVLKIKVILSHVIKFKQKKGGYQAVRYRLSIPTSVV